MKVINKAIILATTCHANQKRKGTNSPYILHPLEAGIIVANMKLDEDIICAAILHDVLEDAKISLEAIKLMFNPRIAELVGSQSEDKSKSWAERKNHTIEYLKKVNDEDVKIVTLGDKLANMRSLYRDYLEIGDHVWERFNEKDKAKQGEYYKGLTQALSDLKRFSEYQEFCSLVDKVFSNKTVGG
jgi:(p)ppGpp synthase/HD superfamily hydrolase